MPSLSIITLRSWVNTARQNATAAEEDLIKLNRLAMQDYSPESLVEQIERLAANLKRSGARANDISSDKETRPDITQQLTELKINILSFIKLTKKLSTKENFMILAHSNTIPWRKIQLFALCLDKLNGPTNPEEIEPFLATLQAMKQDFSQLQNLFFDGDSSLYSEAREHIAHCTDVYTSVRHLLAMVDTELVDAEIELSQLYIALQNIKHLDTLDQKITAFNQLKTDLGQTPPSLNGEPLTALLFYFTNTPTLTTGQSALDPTLPWLTPPEKTLDFSFIRDPIRLILQQVDFERATTQAFKIDAAISVLQQKILATQEAAAAKMKKLANYNLSAAKNKATFPSPKRDVVRLPFIEQQVKQDTQHHSQTMALEVLSVGCSSTTSTHTPYERKLTTLRALMIVGEMAVTILASNEQTGIVTTPQTANSLRQLVQARNAIEHSISDAGQDGNLFSLLHDDQLNALWQAVHDDISYITNFFSSTAIDLNKLSGIKDLTSHLTTVNDKKTETNYFNNIPKLLDKHVYPAIDHTNSPTARLAEEMTTLWLGQLFKDWRTRSPYFDQLLALPEYEKLHDLLDEIINLRAKMAHCAEEHYQGNNEFSYQKTLPHFLHELRERLPELEQLNERLHLRQFTDDELECFKNTTKSLEQLQVNTCKQADTYRKGSSGSLPKMSQKLFNDGWSHYKQFLTYNEETHTLDYNESGKLTSDGNRTIDPKACSLFFACFREIQDNLSGLIKDNEVLISEYKRKYAPIINGQQMHLSDAAIDKLFGLLVEPDSMISIQYTATADLISNTIDNQMERISNRIRPYEGMTQAPQEIDSLLTLQAQLKTLQAECPSDRAITIAYQHAGDITATLRTAATCLTTPPDARQNNKEKTTVNYNWYTPYNGRPDTDKPNTFPSPDRAKSFHHNTSEEPANRIQQRINSTPTPAPLSLPPSTHTLTHSHCSQFSTPDRPGKNKTDQQQSPCSPPRTPNNIKTNDFNTPPKAT
jgi:hypothetical protein